MDTSCKNCYVAFVMQLLEPRVILADESHLDALEELLQVVAEDHPEDATVAINVPGGPRKSLHHFDALKSDCVWLLIAFLEDHPAGLAILTRIPKLDARLGFLYLDELHVIREYRRQGVGRSLLSRCITLAQELGLAGIRLLARIDNEPARRLYESMGFNSNETRLYQYRVVPADPQP